MDSSADGNSEDAFIRAERAEAVREAMPERRDPTEVLIKTLPEPLRHVGPDACV